MSTYLLTSSQTVGPFFSIGLLTKDMERPVLARPGTAGQPIRLEGLVLDGDGLPVIDAMLEIWQANSAGRYNHPADHGEGELGSNFSGFGRTGTAKDGSFWFETIKPGAVPFEGNVWQAPHINLTVFSRGMLNHLVTRLYFEDETANENDPVLQRVPVERRSTLIARREPGDKAVYRFNIVLQGKDETAFFNI